LKGKNKKHIMYTSEMLTTLVASHPMGYVAEDITEDQLNHGQQPLSWPKPSH